MKRNKPSNEERNKKQDATKETYDILTKMAINAVINKQNYVIIIFSYFVKFHEDWPKGFLMRRRGLDDVYKVNVHRLLNFLYNQGYSKQSYKDVVTENFRTEMYISKLVSGFNKSVDVDFDKTLDDFLKGGSNE
jgi:hypothetical protein